MTKNLPMKADQGGVHQARLLGGLPQAAFLFYSLLNPPAEALASVICHFNTTLS
jgi:hypothetical protein